MKLQVDCQGPVAWAPAIIIRERTSEALPAHALKIPLPAGPGSEEAGSGTSPQEAARELAQWELARQRLVMRLLDEVPDPTTHHLVLGAAAEAAAVATTFPYPLLVFPTLLEEAASTALEHERQRAQAYWRRLAVTEL
ncbi:MAG TPA: hypothetical protein PKX23_05210 [Verrucomicrobiota bacterium]|nr:hypothetical protein [Verrucomicrobiota bacterium]HRT06752.1 hypothetical protein [Candidatus Paceibacterota bacterium]HRT57854.1 hypothetical protein [Candidatus Paceibacterota bacterium]